MKVKEPKICPVCGKSHRTRGNYCSIECGVQRILEAAQQQHNHEGPIYEVWKKRWQAATGLKLKGD